MSLYSNTIVLDRLAIDKYKSSLNKSSLTQYKQILLFNNYFSTKNWGLLPGNGSFIKNMCPISNCFITENYSSLGSIAAFDAVLVHGRGKDPQKIVEVSFIILIFYIDNLCEAPEIVS